MKVCASCGIAIDARGRQRFCPPCGETNRLDLKRRSAERERLLRPAQARARQKRHRERHRDELNADSRERYARRPEVREAWRDKTRFGGLKQKVLARDDHQCRVCGATNETGFRNLPIHHINGDPSHNVMENLITLCRECHAAVHTRYEATRQDELHALIA
jgi:5-methylcytosine-specific restriction endonuclease McrA